MTKQKVFITGASSGIGAACAREFAKLGYDLILNARRKERLLELQNEILQQSPSINIELAIFDVQKRQDVETYFQSHQQNIKDVTLLINNAGLAKGVEKVQDSNLDDWDVMIDTNVKGLLMVTHHILPNFLKQNQGHIINLGSVAGRYTYPGGAVYCATKFAVRALTEGLRMDLLGTPIRVTNIEPGMVETEFSQVRLGDNEKARQVYAGMTPLSAKDIAETIVWCSLRPAHVNIQELVIYPTDQAHVGQVARRS
ncbi:MAG: SDR family NAD(P)-dependent oxidoreductase [Bdellovibrionia bacterium]